MHFTKTLLYFLIKLPVNQIKERGFHFAFWMFWLNIKKKLIPWYEFFYTIFVLKLKHFVCKKGFMLNFITFIGIYKRQIVINFDTDCLSYF